MATSTDQCVWSARTEGSTTTFSLVNEWKASNSNTEFKNADRIVPEETNAFHFDSNGLEGWDTSLLVFLRQLQLIALEKKILFDESGLPAAARNMLMLLPVKVYPDPVATSRGTFIEQVGILILGSWAAGAEITSLVGDQIIRTPAALRGRSLMRRADLLSCFYNAGLGALPMVALVNVLVGGFLGFVGAVQLRRFGADIYIANLVGIAEIREMAAVMTAIVISGRTGGAYAAELAAMKGTDELDALSVVGIPVQEYLVLPRVAALALMMPILYLYGSALGILGGLVVAVSTLNISGREFMAQTCSAVSGAEVAFGVTKSLTFGVFIAITSCWIGLKAGRSTTSVGNAATSAVVIGIVGIIALDAVFAVCANAVNL